MLATLLWSLGTLLGDASNYHNLGFSPDGRYFAFAQTGTSDGSGFPYADAGVIEVATNKFVARKTTSIQEDMGEAGEERALRMVLGQLNLAQFSIVPGRNPGVDLWVRLPTDRSPPVAPVFSFDYWAEGGASLVSPRYEVVLQSKDAVDRTENRWCSGYLGHPPRMMRLSIIGRERTSGRTQVLQDDVALPTSRGCVIDYDVRRVTTFNGGIVVVLAYSSPGFEGPDVRSLVVTGRITFRD